MPTDLSFFDAFAAFRLVFLVKLFFVLLVIFYLVFTLILFRQVQIMDRTLPTSVGPFLKFLAIVLIGIALAFMFVIIGMF